MRLKSSFLSGLLFAIGLALSGMTHADNIRGFLDFFGDWKPELMFVMGGATLTFFAIIRLTRHASKPLFESRFLTPTRNDINLPLIGGAALFGVGWGLSGLCPGPAIVSIVTLETDILLFLAAMAVGMTAHTKWERQQEKAQKP